MKHFLTIALFALTATACTEDEATRFTVDPALEAYVTDFYNEAQERGIAIERNLIAGFGTVQGISKADQRGDQYYLTFDRIMFENMKASRADALIEAHVYNRLAGMMLAKDPSNGESFMNGKYLSQSYAPENRDAIIDNTFN